MREITYNQAASEALTEEFRKDTKFVYMSTDVSSAMVKEFGAERIRMTPISESSVAGSAIGLAGSGFRPVVNLRYATFAFVAMDQFVNQAAKITYMFGGQAKFPIVYMMWVGAGRYMAAQHQISPYSMYMNVPGLKIVLPATPYDNKGLLKSALRDNNPVIYFQHTALLETRGEVPEADYAIPFGEAIVRREGSDVTVVALSRMNYEALKAADEMAKQGVSVEVIDPRTLVPMDIKSIRDSVGKTGRLVVVDEACPTCSAASEIVSLVVQDDKTFSRLKSAPKLVTGLGVPIPYSPPLEKFAVPDRTKIMSAIEAVLGG
ncbi:MAG: transketolase C-terminal domain-containing protein [Chloroflexota bacterium]